VLTLAFFAVGCSTPRGLLAQARATNEILARAAVRCGKVPSACDTAVTCFEAGLFLLAAIKIQLMRQVEAARYTEASTAPEVTRAGAKAALACRDYWK